MSKLVWVDRGQITTRNGDGGTTGWSLSDARELHNALGEILSHLGDVKSVDYAELQQTLDRIADQIMNAPLPKDSIRPALAKMKRTHLS